MYLVAIMSSHTYADMSVRCSHLVSSSYYGLLSPYSASRTPTTVQNNPSAFICLQKSRTKSPPQRSLSRPYSLLIQAAYPFPITSNVAVPARWDEQRPSHLWLFRIRSMGMLYRSY